MGNIISEYADIFVFKRARGVVEWAEENIEIPARMSFQPGRFSTLTRPYMREPMECYHPDSGVNDLTLCFGTQSGKTMIKTAGSLYRIDQAPGPMMWVAPTKTFGTSWSKSRWLPLVEGNAAVAQHMPDNQDNFTTLEQHYDDCTFNIAWSNSAAELSSRPIQILNCDEVCKFKKASDEEASALQLAENRTKTYRSAALRAKSSTPTTPDHEFWLSFEGGSQSHLWVPCPHCGEFFVFEHKKYDLEVDDESGTLDAEPDEESQYSLMCDPKARNDDGLWDEEMVRKTAYYLCENCRTPIQDFNKASMLLAGDWQAKNLAAESNNKSYHLPSFYAPDVTFADMFLKYLKGRNLFGLQDYYNSWLAKPWSEQVASVKDKHVLSLRGDARMGVIPFKPAWLLVTADPGEKQTHWMVVAIAEDGEMAVVDYGEVLTIEDCEHLKDKKYKIKGSEKWMRPSMGVMDSGDFTKRVYDFCVASNGFWWPTKGSGATFGTWGYAQVKSHPRLTLCTYIDKTAKDELYQDRIMLKRPPAIILPSNCGGTLIAGITGQKKVRFKNSMGNYIYMWKKLPNDHYGDCLKLGMVGYWLIRGGIMQ